ncbi:MAG TPA: PAS domain-containing protein [Sphingomicrobium sp.]|nr:PAS domain-containing protein [Sphingomicrobium sp.]
MTIADISHAQGSKSRSAPSSFIALASLDQAALDAFPQAVYLCAGDGRVVRFNEKAAELWGRAPHSGDPTERFCGSFRLYRTDGTFLPHDECPMATALETGESFRGQEVIVERPDGERLTVLVNIAPLRDADGEINGAINCFQDITSRKQGEDGLRDSERQVRELIDALPAAVYVTDAEGRITMFNQAAIEFSGRVPELGADAWCVSWKLYRPDGTPLPHDQCPMAVALKEGRAVRGEEAIAERPDGTRIHFAPYPTPIRDETGKIIGAINMLVDITDRKRAEEQRKLLLREMNHRAKNFIAVASSLVTLSAKHAVTKEDLVRTVRDRLDALLRAHELVRPAIVELAGSDRPTTTLHALTSTIFAPYIDESIESDVRRVVIAGPDVVLGGNAATGLALVFHELATNAAKYGPLSTDRGTVEISWSAKDDRLLLRWSEQGGPRIDDAPAVEGFGTALSHMTISGQLDGEMIRQWRPEGLLLELSLPMNKLRE